MAYKPEPVGDSAQLTLFFNIESSEALIDWAMGIITFHSVRIYLSQGPGPA